MGRRGRFFCPFHAISQYLQTRSDYISEAEKFFVFADRSNVSPNLLRNILRSLLQAVNLDRRRYTFKRLRSERASDLLKLGFSVQEIQRLGRWHSNAVYKYLKLSCIFVGGIRAYEQIWFMGDQFCFSSFQRNYYQRDAGALKFYVKEHMDVAAYFKNGSDVLNPNITSRFRGMMVEGIKEQKTFPRLIMIVPDDDIISFLNFESKFGIS